MSITLPAFRLNNLFRSASLNILQLIGLILLLSCSLTASAVTSKSDDVTGKTITQLPSNVRPSHYDIALTPDAAQLSFTGKAKIAIEVLRASRTITLNANALTIQSVELSRLADDIAVTPSNIAVDEKAQTATFTFQHTLAPGDYQLSIVYSGKIGRQAVGLFAIDYDTQEGQKRALYTQFENSDARRVLPCWDEPAYKATFNLEATVPKGRLAVSNMPIAEAIDLDADYQRVRFMPTPKMSTYLLFFGLGDFERSTTQLDGTEIGVVTKKGGTAQAAFVLDATKAILQEYNSYFGTPYPLPKLDNIAAPGRSYFFSAMENWGAIFTFEHAILLDPSISTQADKHRAFSIAAHETAHQWFGDLVTMSWWDDLWLNESFASWLESRTTAKLHPEWNTVLSAIGVREHAMDLDATSTSHAVVQSIKTVDQVSLAFDAITYQKGQAVIRMLEAYVGDGIWRSGIQQYMQNHSYGNTQSADLWREIEAAGGRSIAAIAQDFTLQSGVPLIRVKNAECTHGTTQLQLQQSEFSKDSRQKKPKTWHVPVLIKPLNAATAVTTLLSKGNTQLEVAGCDTLLINAGQSGYFRTLYTPQQFQHLVTDFASLSAIDQLGILADTTALGYNGLQTVSNIIELVKAVPETADPQVWDQVAAILRGIDDFYAGDDLSRQKFRRFAIATLTPIFNKIGWEPQAAETDADAILRNDLINTLGGLGADAVVTESRRRYQTQASDPAAVPAALRKVILGVVARHADAETWEQIHTSALNEKTPLIKDLLYSLLSSSEDPLLAQRALDLALTAEPGVTNSAGMLQAVGGLHPDMAFDFALSHYQAVLEKVDYSSRSRFFGSLGERSFDPEMINKINQYAKTHLPSNARRAAKTSVANIAYRIKIRKERLPEIDQSL